MELDADFLEQLLAVFRSELEEQTELMIEGLLALEKGLADEERHATLHRVFRAAHNIKGAARGVELGPLAELAHKLESLFSTLEKRNQAPSAELVTAALEGVDALRRLGQQLSPGELPPEELPALLERLETTAAAPTEAPAQPPPPTPPPVPAPAAPEPEPMPAAGPDPVPEPAPKPAGAALPAAPTPEGEAAPAPSAEPRERNGGEMVRVPAAKLSDAIALVEELQIAKLQMEGFKGQVRKLEGGIQNLQRLFAALPHERGGGRDDGRELERLMEAAPDLVAELSLEVVALRRAVTERTKRIDFLGTNLQDNLRMMRLVPVSSVTRPLVRSARDIALALGKRAELHLRGDEIEMDRFILERLTSPLTHLLRNALDHGIETPEERARAGKTETGGITLTVSGSGGRITLTLSDDGRGIDLEGVRAKAVARQLVRPEEGSALGREELLELIFRPGFSSRDEVSDLSGRGVGLDVVRSNLREVKGRVWVETAPGRGTTFHLEVPLTLASDRGLLVRDGGETFAVPVAHIERLREVPIDEVGTLEASRVVELDGRPVPLIELAPLLGLPPGEARRHSLLNVIFLAHGWQVVALVVEHVVGEQEMVIKPFRPPLHAVRHFRGGTLDRNGEIVMVLDPATLVESALAQPHRRPQPAAMSAPPPAREAKVPHILVVDDSITTRTLEKNILESRGYRVTLAVNGEEAWNLLKRTAFDLVISDVEMPRMDGFELTRTIRDEARFNDMPVIIVSSLNSEEHKRRGMEAGADAYIVKGAFETATLLETVRKLI